MSGRWMNCSVFACRPNICGDELFTMPRYRDTTNYSTATVFIPAPERGSGGLNGSGWSSWPVRALYAQSRGCSRRPHAAPGGIIQGAGRQVVGPSWAKSRLALFVPPGYRPKPAWGQRATQQAACPQTCGPRSHRAPTGTPGPAHQCSAKLRSRGNPTPKTIC
jgi:hypothetical protein